VACYWGQPTVITPGRYLAFVALVIAVASAIIGFAAANAPRPGSPGVRVDHVVGVIYIERSIPAHFSICDGPDGACLPVGAVRALSRNLR
jgi:hypothetical protein